MAFWGEEEPVSYLYTGRWGWEKKKNPPTAFQLMRFQLSFLADVMTTTNNISLMDIQRN